MKLQFFIALRYLFSKKSYNIINIISMICAGGICVATIALVCTLSVYNGFQQLISGVITSFDPDLRITLKEGKTFDPTEVNQSLSQIPYIQVSSEVLEEIALIRNKEKQTFTTIKGVSKNYTQLIRTDSIIDVGRFLIEDEDGAYTVIGAALANQIEANLGFLTPVSFYAPKYATKVNVANPENSFNHQQIFVGGIYATRQFEIDSKYAFLPLQYAQELFNYGNVVSAIELNISKEVSIEKAQQEIKSILGNKYEVKNKEEQHEDFYHMMKIEKWITFLILFFILIVAVINIIGSLSMLILEKKQDITTLKNLGATHSFIQQIFMLEGWLTSAIGAIIGLVLGIILCLIQEHFGVIKLGNGYDDGTFIVNAYPVCVQATDILLIMFSVLLVGLLIAWIPTRYIHEKEG